MSKFFYDNNIDKNSKGERIAGKNKRSAKLGTAEHPLTLVVSSEKRKAEVIRIVEENKLFADIEVNSEAAENIVELEGVLNKPKTMVFEKTPKRNEPCSCGSGKKYKKCCGA
ncbi:PBPRA1643 family SWIM/SEC-C metal-binding motif protein [Aliikangiella coralliicola]|uniref:Zinc chelation protein SecC n=1 Tax=Aliikangiella coralliicola TaxID=2592383 RepID=A0A545UDY7_9GAMM|nr:PBPRA1643 family SWIM/SEC-C metal-binding motif protein [Aliikangiella coralliicola]TQV87643.1 zinc chelation protein SecC [Aliikangiella coralliicola]